MKKSILGAALLLLATAGAQAVENQPDSLYLFSYTTQKENNTTGLHFAWSADGHRWARIGNEYSFLKSDYGAWGSGKKMIDPVLQRMRGGVWQCSFLVGDSDVAGFTESSDLLLWKPQDYMSASAKMGPNRSVKRDTIAMPDGTRAVGQIHRVERSLVKSLTDEYERKQYLNGLYGEQMKDDATRFAGLKDVTMTVSADLSGKKDISQQLFGVFFEDINYAADGGLYGELVQNRDFEYSEKELSNVKGWGHTYAWTATGGATLEAKNDEPLSQNNPYYGILTTTDGTAALTNAGYDGINIVKGEKYVLTLCGKMLSGKSQRIKVSLRNEDGKDIAVANVSLPKQGWKRLTVTMTATESCDKASLALMPTAQGSYAFDMVSLFPKNTFKGRENGLRQDLAQAIADLKPQFVRFPGGCVAHGNGIDNIYRWKNTVGRLEDRIGMRNIWGYRQSMGLGYYEYFSFCEDIGAEPLPVLAAGVPCQNSSIGGAGQQGGIPLEEMDAYIQDVLDLIEWANGDKSTKWGKVRAEAGHPKPFNLKYIGIGNEDLISDVFKERFTLIYNAVREKHPEIEVVGTVGPFYEGSDYEYGWQLANELSVPIVDEHYYCSPGWFIHNPNFYDSYDRSKSKVYLGEYASHKPNRANDMETALSIANYLTNVERNADVVKFSSYAPLLSRKGHTQWTPDMIYFDNKSISLTTDYYVQRMFGQNAGSQYVPATVSLSNNSEAVGLRAGQSIVIDGKTGDVIIKLTNLLPVPVKTTLELGELIDGASTATIEVLQGQPDDRTAVPVKKDFSISSTTLYEMPAYSFSVIRIKSFGVTKL